MGGANRPLTVKEKRFAQAVVAGSSFVEAYRCIYPPRFGQRSARAEYVAAKRVAHRPQVELHIAALQASAPEEMRRRALTVLSKILGKEIDPRYRRTALDVLKYLDAQNRTAKTAGWAAYRAAAAQIAALSAIGVGPKKRVRPKRNRSPERPLPPELNPTDERRIEPGNPLVSESPEEAQQKLAELKKFVKDRQLARFEEPATQTAQENSHFDDLTQPDEVGRTEREVQYVRKPGHFGKSDWIRQPKA